MPDYAPAAFIDVILGHRACLVAPGPTGVVAQSGALSGLPSDLPWWESDLAVLGEPDRTGLAVGLGAAPGSLRLWLSVPLEGDRPEADLQLLLLLAEVPEAFAPAQRLREALAERESRHAINQPLTALTFLLENLLFACRDGTATPDYLARKRPQLDDQLDRLRALLAEAGALPASLTF